MISGRDEARLAWRRSATLGRLLVALCVGIAKPALADETRAVAILRQIETLRGRPARIEFEVRPDPNYDRYVVQYDGALLRADQFSLPTAPRPGPREWRMLYDFVGGTEDHFYPGSTGLSRSRRILVLHDPRLFGLGAPFFRRPDSVAEALFSGFERPDHVLKVSHALRGKRTIDGVACTAVESTWERLPSDGTIISIRRCIDETRGPSVVLAEVCWNGNVGSRVRSFLRDYDGTWFPERVVTEEVQAGGAFSVIQEIRVRSARFGPISPEQLTWAGMGMEAGMTVHEDGARDPARRSRVWTGQKEVSFDDYRRLRAEGLVVEGPTVARSRRRGRRDAPAPVSQPTDGAFIRLRDASDEGRFAPGPLGNRVLPLERWEEYVRGQVGARGFNAARRNAADAVLHELRARAEDFRRAHAADYARVEAISDRAARDRALDALEQPIGEMFRELRRRIEAL